MDKKLAEFGKNLATKDDINEIKDLFTRLNERLEYQDRKIAALEIEASDHEIGIVSLENDIYELSNTVNNLLDKNAVLSSAVNSLKKQSDAQEQYSRRSCLRINGIEKVADESASDCVKKVVDTCRDMNHFLNTI